MTQWDDDREMLAEEVLNCYDQLNTCFAITKAIARCETARQTIGVLIEEAGRALESRFSYYFGPLAAEFAALEGNRTDRTVLDGAIVTASEDADKEEADEFLARNRESIRQMVDAQLDSQVQTIDYHREHELDYEGRGNVLAVRLAGATAQFDELGMLVFVRTGNREPFVASHMNVARSLGQLASAVLQNIMYAQKLHEAYLQAITSLVRAMEAKDEYTSGHSTRVAEVACHLGRHVGLDHAQIKILEWAGLLHDIGKIGIRDEVLGKQGRLTDEEFDHIKTHAAKSFNVLEPIEALHCVLEGVRHHHEHYDGSGYPDALAGEDIPYLARILQIADVWDALTSTRPYRQAMPVDEAIGIMRDEAGTILDPELAESFLQMMAQENRIQDTAS